MINLGAILFIWMIIGFLYGVYLVFVSKAWDDMQEHKEEIMSEMREGKELFNYIMNSRLGFIVFCTLFGIPTLIGDIKFMLNNKK